MTADVNGMHVDGPDMIEADPFSLPTAARAGGLLFLAGAGISSTLALIDPTYSNGHPFRVLAMAGLAALIGAACLVFRYRVPQAVLYTLPVLGTGIYCSGMALDRSATIGGELILVWPVVLSAYLLPTWVAWMTVVITVGVYSPIAISILHGPGVTPCLALAATLVITLLVLKSLRDRNAKLIDALRSQARTDGLTGLANRRMFSDALAVESVRSRRDRTPLSLLLIDIDLFKQLNDTFGHAAGDWALQSLAVVLRSNVRELDTAARVGGEEFAVLLPGCPTDEASALGERLCRQIERASTTWPHPITISVGVATWLPGSAADSVAGSVTGSPSGSPSEVSDLMTAADTALYRAKREGRNRSRTAVAGATAAGPAPAGFGDG